MKTKKDAANSFGKIFFGKRKDPGIIPKGCKRYYFRADGDFVMEKMRSHPVEIIALNDKNAIRKF